MHTLTFGILQQHAPKKRKKNTEPDTAVARVCDAGIPHDTNKSNNTVQMPILLLPVQGRDNLDRETSPQWLVEPLIRLGRTTANNACNRLNHHSRQDAVRARSLHEQCMSVLFGEIHLRKKHVLQHASQKPVIATPFPPPT